MIRDLIAGGECKTVEFKQDVPKDAARYVPTAVAFANSVGGTIIFGVSDDGEIVGIEEGILKDRVEEVSYSIGAFSEPAVGYNVETYCIDGRMLILARIINGIIRPYRYRGTVYIRQGRNTFKACEEKIQELSLERVNRSYDSMVYTDVLGDDSAKQEAIDQLLQTMREAGCLNPTVELLVSLGVLIRSDQGLKGTRALELLTANRERYEISCAAFIGNEKIDFQDRQEYSGGLLSQVTNAVYFVSQHILRRAVIKGLQREDVYEVPIEAVREAIVNAVLHRSYLGHDSVVVTVLSDRIEIESPGMLMIRAEELGTGLFSTRNAVLARIFREIGYAETRGTGVARMNRACEESGLRKPLIEEVGDRVRVTFFRGYQADDLPTLGRQERSMLEFMLLNPGSTQAEIAEHLGVSKVYVSKLIRYSKDRGVLSRDESLRKGGWIVNSELLKRL